MTHKDRSKGALTDCFYVDVEQHVTLEDYIFAFYTMRLFKLERAILSFVIRKPSTDEGAFLLSRDKTDTFSAWTVEARTASQILLADFSGRTKSWLMVDPNRAEAAPATRLYFGTVAMPTKVSTDGQPAVSFMFHLFGGFHRVYSRALLKAAYKKVSVSSQGLLFD